MKRDTRYFKWGVTTVLTACSILLFYDLLFRENSAVGYMELLGHVLSPVFYGLAMAFLLTPVVNYIEKVVAQLRKKQDRPGWIRALSVSLTWLVVLVLLYAFLRVLLPELYTSLVRLANNVDGYYRTVVSWVQGLMDSNAKFAAMAAELVDRYYHDGIQWLTENLVPKIEVAVQAVTGGIVGLLVWLKNVLVGIIISIYVLGTKERFAATGGRLIFSFFNDLWANRIVSGIKTVNRIFSGVIRGKLLDSLIIGFLCFIFSNIFAFPYAPLVSVVVGVTNMIPFFGPFLGAIPSAFLILLDSPIKCLYFVIFILVLQQIDGNIIGPKILGGRTGLPSFWVMVATLVGGGFFGIKGMILGVPVFACIYAGIRTYSAYRLKKKGLPTTTDSYTGSGPKEVASVENIADIDD